MTVKTTNLGNDFQTNFINCDKNSFNSGVTSFKINELEIFKID